MLDPVISSMQWASSCLSCIWCRPGHTRQCPCHQPPQQPSFQLSYSHWTHWKCSWCCSPYCRSCQWRQPVHMSRIGYQRCLEHPIWLCSSTCSASFRRHSWWCTIHSSSQYMTRLHWRHQSWHCSCQGCNPSIQLGDPWCPCKDKHHSPHQSGPVQCRSSM